MRDLHNLTFPPLLLLYNIPVVLALVMTAYILKIIFYIMLF